VTCQTHILQIPPQDVALVFLPGERADAPGAARTDLSATLARLNDTADFARLGQGVTAGLAELDLPGLSRLTGREREIVTRLVEGDRPPLIAASLDLSQSTVRNHLASVFGKLGVGSQQGLLDLFRDARSRAGTR
jgi:DNA-binding CsgD family transcriptional regulator